MFAIMAPGQGAQTPGMLAGWLRDPARAEVLSTWSQAADCDLVHLGTRASAAEISRTENTQPLLVAQGLLALAAGQGTGARPGTVVAAGHSVGELTAAVFAGVLSPVDAVRLAAARGRAMALACEAERTSMTAVIGGEESDVVAHVRSLGLTPANYNGSGQIVVAGSVDDLERLADDPPPGAALRRLAVAGAFHTQYMAGAVAAFAAAARAVEFTDPRHLLLSNADGAVVAGGAEFRQRLIDQLTLPVRWDRCLRTLDDLTPDLAVALPPGRTLTGMLRRQLPHLEVASITTDRDLSVVLRRLGQLTAASAQEAQPERAAGRRSHAAV